MAKASAGDGVHLRQPSRALASVSNGNGQQWLSAGDDLGWLWPAATSASNGFCRQCPQLAMALASDSSGRRFDGFHGRWPQLATASASHGFSRQFRGRQSRLAMAAGNDGVFRCFNFRSTSHPFLPPPCFYSRFQQANYSLLRVRLHAIGNEAPPPRFVLLDSCCLLRAVCPTCCFGSVGCQDPVSPWSLELRFSRLLCSLFVCRVYRKAGSFADQGHWLSNHAPGRC